jgi:hypothetical protein
LEDGFMLRGFRKSQIPADVRHRLRIAAAVAAEQVLEEHVRSAVEMVEEGSDRAPVDRLLAAYIRLHHMDEAGGRKLRERVLAALGRNGGGSGVGELEAPKSPLTRIRQRVRGRVNADLRDWVERHTARVELSVVDLHVGHALEFLGIFRPYGSTDQALERYTELLGLRQTIAEMVRLKVLKTLHDREGDSVERLHPSRGSRAASFPLRVADNGS